MKVCKRIIETLRARKGSVVLGRQVGSVIAGEKVHRTNEAQSMFRHNEESFRKMWVEVGEATGSKWRVEVEMFEVERRSINETHGPDGRAIKFSVWRE